MDALKEAKRAAENADWKKEPDDTHEQLELAKMYAAIAQAEQLKRIANMFANYFEIMVDGAITSERE